VTGDQEQIILTAHLRGPDGLCTGCRVWWSRLAPYPCWQVEWATSRHARTITARFLSWIPGVRQADAGSTAVSTATVPTTPGRDASQQHV